MILYVVRGDAAALEGVQVVVDGCLAAGDDATVQVGVAFDPELESAIAGKQARLLRDAGIIIVDGGVVDAAIDADAVTGGDAQIGVRVLAVKCGDVLTAADVQVSIHLTCDLLRRHHRALHVGVAATPDHQLSTGIDRGIALGDAAAVLFGLPATGFTTVTKGRSLVTVTDRNPGAVVQILTIAVHAFQIFSR